MVSSWAMGGMRAFSFVVKREFELFYHYQFSFGLQELQGDHVVQNFIYTVMACKGHGTPLVLVLLIMLFFFSSSKPNVHTSSQVEHFDTLGERIHLRDKKNPSHIYIALRFRPHLYYTLLELIHYRKRCQRARNFYSSLWKRFNHLFSYELIELVSKGITSNWSLKIKRGDAHHTLWWRAIMEDIATSARWLNLGRSHSWWTKSRL